MTTELAAVVKVETRASVLARYFSLTKSEERALASIGRQLHAIPPGVIEATGYLVRCGCACGCSAAHFAHTDPVPIEARPAFEGELRDLGWRIANAGPRWVCSECGEHGGVIL